MNEAESEFWKAVVEYEPQEALPIPVKRAYYDNKSGVITEISTEEKDGDYIEITKELMAITLSPEKYRIRDGNPHIVGISDVDILVFKHDTDKFNTVKNNNLFIKDKNDSN